jgi:hypothetical protein
MDLTMWPLKPGDRIVRTELHERFGGRGQGGIGASRKSPNVFLFTDPSEASSTGTSTVGFPTGDSSTRAKASVAIKR